MDLMDGHITLLNSISVSRFLAKSSVFNIIIGTKKIQYVLSYY